MKKNTLRTMKGTGLILLFIGVCILLTGHQAVAQTPFEQRVNTSIENGLQLLRNTQQADGSWLSDFGSGQYQVAGASTGALCFMDQRDPITRVKKGYTGLSPADKIQVDNALAYIVAQQNADGSFSADDVTYQTGLAMVALADAMSTGGPNYATQLNNAIAYFVLTQTDEGEGASPGDMYYGGWNYGGSYNFGDDSNSQFALIGLRAADGALGGGVVPQSTWDKAILFVQHCQNDPSINGLPWAADASRPSYNDGGGIYVPSPWSLADTGDSGSAGGMTSAAIWNYMLCGLSQSDYRVKRALDWMDINFDYDENPNEHGWPFYYYYAYTAAKAFLLTSPASNTVGGLRDPSADGYPEESPSWYYDFAWYLTDTQHADGSFYSNPKETSSWVPMEDTAFAILVLEESAGVHLKDTTTTYIGDNSGYIGEVATLSAKLTEAATGNPIDNEQIIFTLQGKTVSGITGSDGVATVTMTLDPPAGSYTVTANFPGDMTKYLNPSSDSKPFAVLEKPVNTPPDCTKAVPSISEIWPPNHKLVSIAILGVTDPDGDPVTISINGITEDEPVNGLGDGDTAPDGFGIGASSAMVRAERSGIGNGRVYVISFTANDGKGGTCDGYVSVCVPHDQRPGHVCIDDGQKYDLTKP